MDIELVLFDWGGTLAQVVSQNERFAQGAMRAAKIAADFDDPERVGRLIERVIQAEARAAMDPELREVNVSTLLADWVREIGRPVESDRIEAAIRAVGEVWVGSLDLFPGALDAVAELRRRGLRLGLVSNCIVPYSFCVQELQRQGLWELLHVAVTSSQVGYRKPSPLIYAEALRGAFPGGVPADLSRVLFVGDSPEFDVIHPARMGMKTALVRCHVGLWPREQYDLARPDFHLDSVAELPDLLL